jgi:bifunctional isochorismate lyase/aryl carrier protein
MKSYLDERSFLRRARGLVEQASELGRAAFTPGRTALLVIDMQRYFVDPGSHSYVPGAESVASRIRSLVDAFAGSGLPIVFTRHINTDENAGALARWWDDLIREGDPLNEITTALDTFAGTVITKSQYDAFRGTELEELLNGRGVKRIVVTGVVTHLCCETTARSAFVRGFDVTLAVDATVTYGEDHHLATLLNLSHGFATPAFAESILAQVERSDTSSP